MIGGLVEVSLVISEVHLGAEEGAKIGVLGDSEVEVAGLKAQTGAEEGVSEEGLVTQIAQTGAEEGVSEEGLVTQIAQTGAEEGPSEEGLVKQIAQTEAEHLRPNHMVYYFNYFRRSNT